MDEQKTPVPIISQIGGEETPVIAGVSSLSLEDMMINMNYSNTLNIDFTQSSNYTVNKETGVIRLNTDLSQNSLYQKRMARKKGEQMLNSKKNENENKTEKK